MKDRLVLEPIRKKIPESLEPVEAVSSESLQLGPVMAQVDLEREVHLFHFPGI